MDSTEPLPWEQFVQQRRDGKRETVYIVDGKKCYSKPAALLYLEKGMTKKQERAAKRKAEKQTQDKAGKRSKGSENPASQDEAVDPEGSLANEIRSLREDLDQIRDDRDRTAVRLQGLADGLKVLDSLQSRTKYLEDTVASQGERILQLEGQIENLKGEKGESLTDRDQILIEAEELRKKMHNTIMELKGNIRVFCRVRPLLQGNCGVTKASVITYPSSIESLGRRIDLTHGGQRHRFTFDKVFNHKASQQDVFDEVSLLVQSALDGYKVCIFAYGQTGSGKTYTMMGGTNLEERGLIPRSLEQIARSVEDLKKKGWKYQLKASMLEIYNDNIYDLLSTNQSSSVGIRCAEKVTCKMRHDANGDIQVSNLTILEGSIEEIFSSLQQASNRRAVGRTSVNDESSRSHFVFNLHVSGVNEGTKQVANGILNLIDLAGSENAATIGATGDRLVENKAINKSLLGLGNVIRALANKEQHVPYRTSKLTHLLEPCLRGDSKMLMFVNISPYSSFWESYSSLKFAAEANNCEVTTQTEFQTVARPFAGLHSSLRSGRQVKSPH